MRLDHAFFLIILLCIGCETVDVKKEKRVIVKPDTPYKSLVTQNLKATTVQQRILIPKGFERVIPTKNSFAFYLQNFPLKAAGSKVYYFNGEEKHTQTYHAAVLDIDIGKRDLQQCADAIIRLRAEYLYHQKKYDDIHFNFTNGFFANYNTWRSGQRIAVSGNKVSWYDTHKISNTYDSFRKYLDMVFSYAGTLSLSKELNSKIISEIAIGDVFIQGGSPGHAVLVMDMAIHKRTGEKIFLLAQSYMPAQDIHILTNGSNTIYDPWYSNKDIKETLRTPEWTFSIKDLKSFYTN